VQAQAEEEEAAAAQEEEGGQEAQSGSTKHSAWAYEAIDEEQLEQQQRDLKQQGVKETGAEMQAFGHLCGRLANGDDNAGDITDNPAAFHRARCSGRREFSTPSPEQRACASD
jgi:hypothetical protein